MHGLTDAYALLEAGEPSRAAEVLKQLRNQVSASAELQLLEETAQSWSLAQELAAQGEYTQAALVLEPVPRLGLQRFAVLRNFQQQVEKQRREIEGLERKLQQAMQAARWREAMAFADQLLALAPQHVEARVARAQATRSVDAPTESYKGAKVETKPGPAGAMVDDDPLRRMLLWIDGVGGYLLCLSPRVSLGQATPESYVDIPIFADISRVHAFLNRDNEGYLLESLRPVSVNHKPTEKALLRDGDRLTLGTSCQLRFHQPLLVSATARLEMVSGHRFPLAVDGVVLMADSLILGPVGTAHIAVPDAESSLVLFRSSDGLGVRAAGDLTVDGQRRKERVILGTSSTVVFKELRFTLEPAISPAPGSRNPARVQ